MTFYITTPIYYVNDTPHIGHAYTTVTADVLARYHKLFGDEVLFLTGTDEHGQKVEQAAKKRGLDPKLHCDEMVLHFKNIWKELNCEYDIFMRTTEEFHKKGVQASLQFLYDKGEIYEHTYDGWYSVSEEIFYTEKDLVDGKSPTGKEVTKVSEKNYFFKMSLYQERLIDYINKNPDFIKPEHKKSEVLGFLKSPLSDLCISRPKERLSWGIELPFDKGFVTYVWFDALLNYATAIGYHGPKDTSEKYKHFWPHTTHLLGKDILITHTVYWTTMLMALGQPLPKHIFAHGWWLTGDAKKMSKSEGPVVKPLDMKEEVGVDGLRYYLSRDITLGNDAQFSRELVIQRLNSELSNNLGNLLSRSVSLIVKYFDGIIPESSTKILESQELQVKREALSVDLEKEIRSFNLSQGIGLIVELLSETNKYIDTLAPWKAAKEDKEKAAETLGNVCEVVSVCCYYLLPVMPSKAKEILDILGVGDSQNKVAGKSIKTIPPLFPRYEI